MKIFLSLVLVFVLSLSGFSQTIDPVGYNSPVKVACIGNSIYLRPGAPSCTCPGFTHWLMGYNPENTCLS